MSDTKQKQMSPKLKKLFEQYLKDEFRECLRNCWSKEDRDLIVTYIESAYMEGVRDCAEIYRRTVL